MSLNDIVVYVDSAEATKARVEFAVALAKDHGAHLLGIAFAPTALLPLYGADVGLADMSEVLEGVKAQGESALHAFKARAKAEGVSAEGRLMQGMSEELPRDFACSARHVDLAIIGQPRDGDPLIGQYALVERCLFASGRPVIIVPAVAEKVEIAGTVVVAWDGSAEAARAFNDALTFLKRPSASCCSSALPEEGSEPPGSRRHGGASEAPRRGCRNDPLLDRRGRYRQDDPCQGEGASRRHDRDGSVPSFALA